MAAWRKLSVNSAVARERDTKVARSHGWNSLADENIESEACESIDSDDSEYLEYARELEYATQCDSDRSNGCDDDGAALAGHVLGSASRTNRA